MWLLKVTVQLADELRYNLELVGEVTEWPIVLVSKTSVPRGTEGSNPSLSAQHREDQLKSWSF